MASACLLMVDLLHVKWVHLVKCKKKYVLTNSKIINRFYMR